MNIVKRDGMMQESGAAQHWFDIAQVKSKLTQPDVVECSRVLTHETSGRCLGDLTYPSTNYIESAPVGTRKLFVFHVDCRTYVIFR